jgi:hypothetical protein
MSFLSPCPETSRHTCNKYSCLEHLWRGGRFSVNINNAKICYRILLEIGADARIHIPASQDLEAVVVQIQVVIKSNLKLGLPIYTFKGSLLFLTGCSWSIVGWRVAPLYLNERFVCGFIEYPNCIWGVKLVKLYSLLAS